MQLRRDVGTLSLLLIAAGGIVGSGWLFGPLYTAQAAGPAGIISWFIGGLLMMLIALTFAELASAFPVSGGVVRFMYFSHGAFASFTIAWVAWLAALLVAPIETLAAIQYADNYLPGLVVSHQGVFVLTGHGFLVACGLMLLMCVINFFGVRYFAKSNNILVVWKLIIPIAAAFY